VFVAVVVVALRVAQGVFGAGSKRAAATEVAARLVSYPTGSSAALRRRFVRALTGQHVIMPSGERLAFAELTVRVAPEDLERLDPDGDIERLGADAAKLYLAHAQRAGWATSSDTTVTVEVDAGLRPGWVPPARGTARPEARSIRGSSFDQADSRVGQPRAMGWDVVVDHEPPAEQPAQPAPPQPVQSPADVATMNFPALVPDLEDDSPTMNVVGELRLQRGSESFAIPREGTVLGRLLESPVTFPDPEVSFRHAAVRLHDGQWQIKDLGSTNGTTVDGTRVAHDVWTPLRDGSAIGLAGVRLVAATSTFGTVHIQGDRREGLTSR